MLQDKDSRLEGVKKLLAGHSGSVFALVVDDSGKTNAFISDKHSLNQTVYASLFLLIYASQLAESHEEEDTADCLDEAIDCLEQGGYGFDDYGHDKPLN